MSGEERKERLSRLLSESDDWQKTRTDIDGVLLVKMPQYKSRPPTLALEINPIDATGSSTKKRGIVIRSSEELSTISQIVSDPRLAELAASMDSVNPATSGPKKSADGVRV